jgi:hypothetical protein
LLRSASLRIPEYAGRGKAIVYAVAAFLGNAASRARFWTAMLLPRYTRGVRVTGLGAKR